MSYRSSGNFFIFGELIRRTDFFWILRGVAVRPEMFLHLANMARVLVGFFVVDGELIMGWGFRAISLAFFALCIRWVCGIDYTLGNRFSRMVLECWVDWVQEFFGFFVMVGCVWFFSFVAYVGIMGCGGFFVKL